MTIFSKIISGEIPSNKVLENDNFLSFYDIAPQAPIHIVVIPKEYYKNFNDIPAELMVDMTIFIKEIVKKVGIEESGYRLITNCGDDGGQEVQHLHFHILGGGKVGKLVG